MTKINTAELSQITYVDEALMWCVIELYTSNHHPDNVWLSDDASVRADAVNLVSWNVLQDDKGNGQFVFNALLPLINPHPMQTKASIIECVKTYTPFILVGEPIDYPSKGKGLLIPELPDYITSLEQLLVWLVLIVEAVNRYLKLINALIDAGVTSPTPTITNFQITLDPALATILEGVTTPNSAEGIISQYENAGADPNATPEWYLNLIDNLVGGSGSGGANGGGGEPRPVDPGNGNNSGVIDTLPVCKEQDPKIVAFSKDGIFNLSNI